MSFRTRLTSFFLIIVIVPMVAIGLVLFRLIDQNDGVKADARVSGLANAAVSLYAQESLRAQAVARGIAAGVDLSGVSDPAQRPALTRRLAIVTAQAGVARLIVSAGTQILISIGSPKAIAPGRATTGTGSGAPVIAVALTNADDYARDLAGRGVQVVVRNGRAPLATTLTPAATASLPASRGTVTIAGRTYRVITQVFPGFGSGRIHVSVLSDLAATQTSTASNRLLAIFFIAGFILLAFGFSVLASRQLSSQVARFLQAARRLGGGDFSSPVPTDGQDEFAELGHEFNRMSRQLEQRLNELRAALRRTGQTFAANLDRPALLGIALGTAIDGVQGDAGRVTSRATEEHPLTEVHRVGSLLGVEEAVLAAERMALERGAGGVGEATAGDRYIAAVALGPFDRSSRSHGVIVVSRAERAYNDDDRDVLRSLATQTTLAVENVRLHHQVKRQAVTDELTGLVNHRRFQEVLGAELEQVRRYHHSVGLIMIDVDNFKRINDTFGHPQGDVVLREVADVVGGNSRDADTAARYGGEEMALVLPHTDLEGAHAIAERVRTAIEALRIPQLDGDGELAVTASLGVSATTGGAKDELIAEADRALYEAKRAGKNQTVRAGALSANGRAAE